MTSLIFFGSDQYSAIVLNYLLSTDLRVHGYTDLRIITDQPKPKGKERVLGPNEVEIIANSQNINVLYYQDNKDELISYIKQSKSTGLSASFPHLFPPSVITAFDSKLFNLHPSLLPQYRNVAPGPYAIAMGDQVTGISLFPIGIGIDNGELVAQQKEDILSEDTTSTLLTRLFKIGTVLFLKYLDEPDNPTLTKDIPVMSSAELIFTRKLKRESGYIEWDTLEKLIVNKPITKDEAANPLISLRLTHHPERTQNILRDLIRALDTYERVWTTVPQAKLKRSGEKGELQLTLSLSPTGEIMVLIPGKPKPISYSQFLSNYL